MTDPEKPKVKVVERKRISLFRKIYVRPGEHKELAFTSGVVTIYNEVTGGVENHVLDDRLRDIEQELAGAKRFEVEPRPDDWLSPSLGP